MTPSFNPIAPRGLLTHRVSDRTSAGWGGARARCGTRPAVRQATAQVWPPRVKAVGSALLPVQVPVKPKDTDDPGATVPFQLTFPAVTAAPKPTAQGSAVGAAE